MNLLVSLKLTEYSVCEPSDWADTGLNIHSVYLLVRLTLTAYPLCVLSDWLKIGLNIHSVHSLVSLTLTDNLICTEDLLRVSMGQLNYSEYLFEV